MGEIGKKPARVGALDGLTTGKRIAKLRVERGLSVAHLAATAEMTAQAIQKLEAGDSNEPSYLNGLRIAFALSVTPWQLAGEPEPVTLDEVAAARRRSAERSDPQLDIEEKFREMSARHHEEMAALEKRLADRLEAALLQSRATPQKRAAK